MPSCQRSVGDVNVLGLVFLIRGQFCHGGALENCASASQSLRSSLVRADRRSGCWLEISLPWPSMFSLECVLTASGFSACAAVAGDLLVGFRWQCQLYTERYPRHAQDILTVEMSARSRKGSNDFGWNSSSIPGDTVAVVHLCSTHIGCCSNSTRWNQIYVNANHVYTE